MSETYTSTETIKINGSGQGGANSAHSYNDNIDLFLDCLDKENNNNAILPHVCHNINQHNIGIFHSHQFADDSTFISVENILRRQDQTSEEGIQAAVGETIRNQNRLTKQAGSLLPLSGGRYNDKGWCLAIIWKRRSDDNKTPYRIKELDEDDLLTSLPNQYDPEIPISIRQLTEASKSIGYGSSLSGSNKKEMDHQISEGRKMLRNSQSSGLSTANGIRLYQNVVAPARIYALLPHQWEEKHVTKIQAEPIKILLSSLRICSMSNRSIMHGPTRYGCRNLSRWSTTITATQCSRALKELNSNDRNDKGLYNLISHQQRDMAT